MSLQSRLGNLVSAIGADIKSLGSRVSSIENGSWTWDAGPTPTSGGGAIASPTVRSGMEIASTVITAPVSMPNNNTYFTQGTLVVPAGSPAHTIELLGGLIVQVVTGTVPAETLFRFDLSLFDETNAVIAYSSHQFSQGSTAASKSLTTVLPASTFMPANAATKTYTVQARAVGIQANGSTAAVLIGGIFPNKLFRAVSR